MKGRLFYGLGLFLCLAGVVMISSGPWWLMIIGAIIGTIGFFMAFMARFDLL
jgi:hypothetical protein